MQTTLALVAALASVAVAVPATSAPAGCSASYSGTFGFNTYLAGPSKRELSKRAGGYTLVNSVFKDSQGRTGEIVSNHQFQFDSPPQTGNLGTGPWSVCSNGSIALGGTTMFYQCEKEPNTYDIYDSTLDPTTLAGCEAVTIDIIPDSTSSADPTSVSQASDGQPTAASATQLSDGQPQVATASQLTDGQIQAPTPGPKPTVSQLTDGQPQAPSATPKASQLSDGQPQVPSATVSQLTDGQPQAPSATAKVSQLSDGQPQVPSATASASQLTDGQPQVASATSKVVPSASQLPDGQPQVGNATTTTTPFTGAGNSIAVGSSFVGALFVAVAALL